MTPQHVIFALPPNLARYGAIRIPSAVLVLGSLAEQAGHTTDFLLASPEAMQVTPSDAIFSPSSGGIDPSRLVQEYAEALLARVTSARAQGRNVVLGMSCFSSALYQSTQLVGAWVRDRFPDLPILVGGYHPTIDPESLTALPTADDQTAHGVTVPELAAALDRISARHDHIFDYVFSGRAEGCFIEHLAQMAVHGRPERSVIVPSSAWSDEQVSRFRYSTEILDRLAGQPRKARDPERHFDLCFSFGCPYRCAFCIQSTHHESWQPMDVDHAIEVVERLHLRNGVTHFSILDANFGVEPKWRERFFGGLAAKPWAERIQLNIEASVGTFSVPEGDALDRLGITVQIGVESCSTEILARMQKTRNPQKYRDQLRSLLRDLVPRADLVGLLMIFGFPGETRKTLRETFDFLFDECHLLSLPNVALVPQLYLPLLGTEAHRRQAEYEKELGFQSTTVRWWHEDAGRRFLGMRPSHELPLTVCAQLLGACMDYFFGDGTPGSARGGQNGAPPIIGVKTKLQKRAFRDRVHAILGG